MTVSGNTALEQGLAQAALALTGLEVTLATLRDNGVIQNAQLVEIVHRLSGIIDTFEADAEGASNMIVSTMRARLSEMSSYLGCDLRQN